MQVLRSDPGKESSQCRTNSSVGFKGSWGDHRWSDRAFLALSDGSGFAHCSSGFNGKRGGDLHVDELVGILNVRFGDAHVHSRTVFGIYGRARTSMSAHRPIRRAMLASSYLNALCLAERACPHGHEAACLPSLSRTAPHSVPSRFLFLHRLPGSHTALHNRILAACWNAEL